MLNKTKEFISRKRQEYKAEKKQIEESNANYHAGCAKNKNLVESRQKEADENMRCPLCQGDEFFKHIRIAYTDYNGNDCSTYIALDKEEGLSAYDNSKNGIIPLNTYVCKRCGNIILKMNFSFLDDPTLIPPIRWDK